MNPSIASRPQISQLLATVDPELRGLALMFLEHPSAAPLLAAGARRLATVGNEAYPLSNFICESFVTQMPAGPGRFLLRHADFVEATFIEVYGLERVSGNRVEAARAALKGLFGYFAAGLPFGGQSDAITTLFEAQLLYGSSSRVDEQWEEAELRLAA